MLVHKFVTCEKWQHVSSMAGTMEESMQKYLVVVVWGAVDDSCGLHFDILWLKQTVMASKSAQAYVQFHTRQPLDELPMWYHQGF
jgi:hypothetical protein